MSDEHTRLPDPSSSEAGVKDTDDLSDVKPVPHPGMVEKGKQVDQTPKDVTGEHDALTPQRRLP